MIGEHERLALVERRTEELLERLRRVEAAVEQGGVRAKTAAWPRPEAPEGSDPVRPAVGQDAGWMPVAGAVARTAAQAPSRVAPPAAAQRPALEDLLAGRVLAWAGGLAVLVGIVLLFAVAVSRGWIGEGTRTMLGALASLSLVAAGAWLHERRGRTDAALAAVAAGIGGLFAASVVAARVYELIPLTAGLAAALGTGAVATALALRWHAQGIAALGILGGLAAPLALGAIEDGGTIAILFATSLSAAALCVRFDWDAIASCAFGIATLQWLAWISSGPPDAAAVACLAGFGALNVAMAVGFELRTRAAEVRPVSVLLLAFNAFLVAAAGWYQLGGSPLWLVAVGAAHAAVGIALLRSERASRALALLACGLGVAVLDIALGQLLSGVVLAFAWAAIGAAFAPLVARVRPGGLTEGVVGAGLGAHLALSLGHALTVEAPPEAAGVSGLASIEASAAIAVLAAVCFASSRVLRERETWRSALDALGLVAVGYLAAINLDGAILVAALAGEAVLLAEIARRSGDRVAAAGAVASTAIALGHALAFEAPPYALVDGVDDLTAAAIALIAVAIAAWRCATAWSVPGTFTLRCQAPSHCGARHVHIREASVAAWVAASVALLHLASVGVVTAAGAGPRAQALLSALWALAGVAALIAGLVRDVPALRTGAFALLLAALAKVFLYDLATLTPIARVASFIALGLLLLLGAFAWQRIRPNPLPDLREAPDAMRG